MEHPVQNQTKIEKCTFCGVFRGHGAPLFCHGPAWGANSGRHSWDKEASFYQACRFCGIKKEDLYAAAGGVVPSMVCAMSPPEQAGMHWWDIFPEPSKNPVPPKQEPLTAQFIDTKMDLIQNAVLETCCVWLENRMFTANAKELTAAMRKEVKQLLRMK